MTSRMIPLLLAALFAGAYAQAQAVAPEVQPSPGLDALRRGDAVTQAAPLSPTVGKVAFDAANPAPAAPVEAGDDQPIVSIKPRGADTGNGGDGAGLGGGLEGELSGIVQKVLKDPAVGKALDGVRKEQSDKFAKEVVDKVTADPRIKKLAEGPSKTKSIIVSSGIGGAGALMAGIGFAVGLPALGFVGLGVLGAGLVGLLIAWL